MPIIPRRHLVKNQYRRNKEAERDCIAQRLRDSIEEIQKQGMEGNPAGQQIKNFRKLAHQQHEGRDANRDYQACKNIFA